jgi:hypothetical protein
MCSSKISLLDLQKGQQWFGFKFQIFLFFYFFWGHKLKEFIAKKNTTKHKFIGERRTTFAKVYGTKLMCYWEFFTEHV